MTEEEMKKIFIFGLIVAALGFTACSSEDELSVNNDSTQKKGMVLRATVEQPAESRATFTNNEGVWHFDFTEGDQIMVTNKKVDIYYTFTYDGTDFISADAEPTSEPTRWYAYFPSREVSLVGQTGKWEDLANVYALIGSTFDTTGDVTGEEGLTINLNPAKLAFLKIENRKGSIDINVKNGADSWVKGLTVSGSSFIPVSMLTKQTLLSTTKVGTYYIAVPAGQQLAVKDGDKVVKSTGENGFTAGKYYELTIAPPTTGTAERTGNIDVNWVQLWEDGPKFAEYNVGATSATEYGGYYTWGGTNNNDPSLEGFTWTDDHYTGASNLSGNYDTATYLWGSNWRMPTRKEIEALSTNCTVEWIDGDTKKYKDTTAKGVLCTGKGYYSENSIFLPAAGYGSWSTDETGDYYKISQQDKQGYFWTSTCSTSVGSYSGLITHQYPSPRVASYKIGYTYSVRAVLK